MPSKHTSSKIRRSGKVALVGRPNVGKSTLLNAAVGQALAIVSPVPQTTRNQILGVVPRGEAQIALLDTPGLHKPHSRLGRSMNVAARDAAREADVVVYVTDVPSNPKGPIQVHPGDRTLLTDVGAERPILLVVNKIDRLKDKAKLLPLLDELSKIRDFAAVVPISARTEDGVELVLDEVAKLLPEQGPLFGDDMLTDRPIRFFAAEYVREQIMLATREEVPHAAGVEIRSFDESGDVVRIEATIHVERDGQKRILIGEKGAAIKAIGIAAREKIEELLERRVHLELWVEVTPGWTDSPVAIAELGYGEGR